MQPKKESLVTQTNRRNKIEEVTQEGEHLTKEVEVEEEEKKMYLDVTNVTNWVIDILNVQSRKT